MAQEMNKPDPALMEAMASLLAYQGTYGREATIEMLLKECDRRIARNRAEGNADMAARLEAVRVRIGLIK